LTIVHRIQRLRAASRARADEQRAPNPVVPAYDTGMREGGILNLRWLQVDLRIGAIKLGAADTKTNSPRRST
jgi:integrase